MVPNNHVKDSLFCEYFSPNKLCDFMQLLKTKLMWLLIVVKRVINSTFIAQDMNWCNLCKDLITYYRVPNTQTSSLRLKKNDNDSMTLIMNFVVMENSD